MEWECTYSNQGSVLVIQPDWTDALKNDEKIWAYHKKLNDKSTHGFLEDGKFDIVSHTGRSIVVKFSSKPPVTFVSPISKFTGIHNKSVQCLDVSSGGLGVSVCADSNRVIVWETHKGLRRRTLDGHVFDAYTCCLFPSGVVILSGGADMQIKIWDAATGVCPVTLIGHTCAITDMCIIEKGKNIISVSKDGTARLWNCAESKSISTLLKVETQINCCDLVDISSVEDLNSSTETPGESEFCTDNKLVALGCEDGRVYLVRVCTREIVITHFLSSPIRCLCWLNCLSLLIGLEDGRIVIIDVRRYQEVPQTFCHDSASAALCIKPLLSGFVIGRRDGLCQFYKMDGKNYVQFTGPDIDPIYSIAHDGQFVYTACRDKIIRKYSIQDMKL